MLPMLSELNEKLQDRVGRERQEEKKPARLKLASVVRSSLHQERCDRTVFAFRQSQRPQDDREALIWIEHNINTAQVIGLYVHFDHTTGNIVVFTPQKHCSLYEVMMH